MINRTHALRVLATLIFSAGSLAFGQVRSPQEWIELIEAQAENPESPPDAPWEAVRRVCGWAVPSHSGKRWNRGEVANAWPVFIKFMHSRGYDILNKTLRGTALTETEEPYRRLMLALYLRAAVDHRPGRPAKDRQFQLDMERVHGSIEDCRRYSDGVIAAGQSAILKGIIEQELSADDIEAMRLYRIAAGAQVVGECFLPSHFGLHPYKTGRGEADRHGHGMPAIKEVCFGRRYLDFRSPTFEAVLKSPQYTDVVDYAYHWTYAMRVEGVLEFLRPIACYRSIAEDGGRFRVELRGEMLKGKDGQGPADFVRLGNLAGTKPVLLYMNDPVDRPVTEMFERFEVLYRAYRDRMHILFVAVNIHDWFYSGMTEFFTGPGPSRHAVGHAWCVEERARKLKNRYLESPHVTFPAIIDDDGQTVKNLYGTSGGANHFVIIDREGKIAEFVRNQHGGLNEVEAAIRRTLDNDGLMADDARIEAGHERTQVPELEPVRHRVRLQAGTVESVDPSARTVAVAVEMEGTVAVYAVRVPRSARLVHEGRPIALSDVQVGAGVLVECFLDQMTGDTTSAPNYQELTRQTIISKGRTLVLEPLGNYGSLRRVWYVMADSEPGGLTARSLEIISNHQESLSRWPSRVTVWACGKVRQCDVQDGILSVERLTVPAAEYKGHHFYVEAMEAGQRIHPNETVTQRLAVVSDWIESRSHMLRLRMDDGVDVIINGRFGLSWSDIRIGDFVGVEYDTVQHGQEVLAARTVRVSR